MQKRLECWDLHCTVIGTTLCENYDADVNGTAIGWFKCPFPFEPSSYTACCGDQYTEFCCAPDYGYGIILVCKHDLTLITKWIGDYIHYNIWDVITYPFPNFNGATVEVWDWIRNFIPHFTAIIHLSDWEAIYQKPQFNWWCKSLIIDIEPVASARWHILMSPLLKMIYLISLDNIYSAKEVTHNASWILVAI